MLEPILDDFASTCRQTPFRRPRSLRVESHGHLDQRRDVTDPDYWVRHYATRQRFREGIDTILADSNRAARRGGTRKDAHLAGLHGPVRPAADASPCGTRNESGSDCERAGAIAWAWRPVSLDAAAPRRRQRSSRRALTYPFEHQRYGSSPTSPAAAGDRMVMRKWRRFEEWFAAPSGAGRSDAARDRRARARW
jgi:acyl transferase domain-containing protein